MKPTKNLVYCHECFRTKMLFENEKKALTFIKFNGNEIKNEKGYSPTRAYYCVSCCGWHVTSKELPNSYISTISDKIIDAYNNDKINIKKKRKACEETRKKLFSNLNDVLNELEYIGSVYNNKDCYYDCINRLKKIKDVMEDLSLISGCKGTKKKIKRYITFYDEYFMKNNFLN